ncbi:MAG TPA: HlyD family efflux transporter periplasmic adaptor subunit [Candidatus Acidoferrum sp.]|nr:HlyD family efflux transporter periplasmic adaptor subunit [Candidatus Acidoferrum sp.]
MNIANALNVALPELPERVIKRSVPKLDPRVIAKQQIEKGQPTVLAKLPGADNFIRLHPPEWVLLQLCDGERSYLDISVQVTEQTGVTYSEEVVREFAAFIQTHTDLFYKSPLEKNIALQQKLRSQRLKRKRSKTIDFADIVIAEWPEADDFISRIYPSLRWIYTWWFTLLALAMFVVMAWMWAGRFGEIWRDSFEFYNFTTKSGRDLLEFWVLFASMAFLHESFHGLTCKHFGGNVEKMGFSLMYFAPSFFCDVTQIWIYGGKWERIATVIAGIWGDLIVCFFATVVWWATSVGMLVHNLAYKVMMVTGIGVSLLNLNPLIKLDGYYIFTELIGEPDFKERTSAYFSGWTRKHIFRMPAEVEYVPRRQRPFYLVYAVLSGIYGYVLLTFLTVLTYNVLHTYSPAWAFLPATLMGYWVFRARIHTMGRFTKLFYLDKKERIWSRLTPLRAAFGVAALLLLLLPIWPDLEEGTFVLEPARQAVVHASVRGRVSQVFVEEGQSVVAGQPLAHLENLDLESDLARVGADLRMASSRATQSELRYGDYGTAEQERQRLLQEDRSLTEEAAALQLVSPIAGIVATPRLRDLTGAYFEEGAPVIEVIDPSTLLARIYVPEFAMHDIRLGATVRLRVQSRLLPVTGILQSISADWAPLDPAMSQKDQLSGINPPRFYMAEARLDRAEELRPGITGMAKIRVGRRSLARLSLRFVRDLVTRRVW